jgi:hypothetical protein
MANSAPTLNGLTTSATFLENSVNATPQLLDADITFTDLDNDFTNAGLTVSGLIAEDTVAIRNVGIGVGEIGISGSNVTFGGTIIGTFAGGAGATLTVTFNASATAASIEALVENLTYANSSDTPAASRTLQIKIADDDGVAAIAAPTFTVRTGAANPFDGFDVGLDSMPSFADLDGDGDLDAFVGRHDGHLHYFQNIGSAAAPAFAAAVGDPFGLANDPSAFARTPSFADLDGDGDLDAFTGENTGVLYYFENTGSSTAPAYAAALTNPFGLANVGDFSTPSFADLDGDGDLDAIVGEVDGNVYYFQNTGSAIAPAFAAAVANPFGLADVGDFSTPSFIDLDGDGDLDATVGAFGGTLNYFENTGSATAPAFAAAVANPFGLPNVGSYSNPSFADLDADGDLDAIVGEEDGTLNYVENTTPKASAPDFVAQIGAANPFDGIDVGAMSTPSFADLDGDGDLDAFVGALNGNVYYFQNTGSAIAPIFAAAVVSPFGLADVGSYSAPSFADLDGDGDLDAIVGEQDGTLNYFQNIGSAIAPAFAAAVADPFGLSGVGDESAPSFADLDGDGDLDAIVGERFGNLRYFQNTGSAVAPAFAAAVVNPFGLADVGSYSTPSFADIDGDGDLDALVGEIDGTLNYFENTGSAKVPAFTEHTGAANPFDLIDVGIYSTLSFADLDGDGDLDVIVGEYFGNLRYFQNTGAGFAIVVNVTAQNDAPAASANAGLTVNEGAGGTIGQTLLTFTDPEQTASQLIFTVTSGPANGTLAKGGVSLGVGGTFTQADIDANLITYTHDGGETASDAFGFGVSDGAGGNTAGTFALTITAQNDAPAITSNGGGATASVSIAENSTAVTTVTANDADGPSLSYTISGGADAARFQIDITTGALAFVTAPNFEAPTDADADNSYVVEVQASDGSLTDTQTITVNVTNADETINLSPGDDSFTAPAGIALVNALGGIDTVTFGFKLVDATVTYSGSTVIVDGPSSHTVLTGFERFAFTDGTVDNADGNRLVDDLFYYSQNHDVWNAHADADLHYGTTGWHEGRDPSAFFDTSIYLSANPDVAASGINPLTHYDTNGWKEGRVPSLRFDGRAYLDANPDVKAAQVDPLLHFLASGASEGRQPIAPTELATLNGFDFVYYLASNPDVAAAGVDPFWHFQNIGWKEGRDPNAWFDTAGYLAVYTDVAAAHINPLDHYNQFGWHEGRDPSLGFDTASYLAANPDVAAAHVNPLVHFLMAGHYEGRTAIADGVWG